MVRAIFLVPLLQLFYLTASSIALPQTQADMPHPVIYMIRHGEKDKVNGVDQSGLNAAGLTRAQELVGVFGKSSDYNIGNILAEKRGHDGKRLRPYETVEPLAQSLGITIEEIKKDDTEKAVKHAKKPENDGNVLICWEHGVLGQIAGELMGLSDPKDYPVYPGNSFGTIWTFVHPYTNYTISHEAGTAQ